jgi:hypothetical protein
VAHVAIPKDECRIRLDDLEGVFALAGLGHSVDAELQVSFGKSVRVGREDKLFMGGFVMCRSECDPGE